MEASAVLIWSGTTGADQRFRMDRSKDPRALNSLLVFTKATLPHHLHPNPTSSRLSLPPFVIAQLACVAWRRRMYRTMGAAG